MLVPLAGQSPDSRLAREKGFDPVGVEVSPIACEAFFAARGAFVERRQARFVCWKGHGVTLLQGDFFRLEGTFGAALDRGALVALPQAIRAAYAQKLIARLLPTAPIFLVTVEYDRRRRVGPPFPVFSDEVRRLFPNAVVRARKPLKRARWDSVGGADSVVWFVREANLKAVAQAAGGPAACLGRRTGLRLATVTGPGAVRPPSVVEVAPRCLHGAPGPYEPLITRFRLQNVSTTVECGGLAGTLADDKKLVSSWTSNP